MRILFLTPALPNPPLWGGARRMHGLISGLAQRHTVSVLALASPRDDISGGLTATQTYCEDVVAITNGRLTIGNSLKRRRQALALLSPKSYDHWLFCLPEFQNALDRLLARRSYDIITAMSGKMGYYRLPRTLVTILDEHNIEYDLLHRMSAGDKGIRRLYNYVNFLKLRHEEWRMWRQFDGCTVPSRRDEQVLLNDSPQTSTAVVPNAVDTDFFRPNWGPSEPMTIVFFGANHYYPNTDAITYFVREILPIIKRDHPQAQLLIVGNSPEALYRLAAPDIILTGTVDDIRDYLARASVIVAPLRIGGGTRLKILEAMAMGKPVVATAIGAEGLDVTHQKDILLADTAEDFARQVSYLLSHPAEALALGQAARTLVEQTYTWSAAVTVMERFFERVANEA